MQNSQENPVTNPISFQSQPNNKLFQLIYIINEKQPLRHEVHSALTVANMILVLFIYLSLKHVALFEPFFIINNIVIVLILFCIIFVIVLQLAIGLMYSKQFFIKAQFLFYRNIVYPIALLSLITINNKSVQGIVASVVALLATIILLTLQWLIGRQSYAKNLIIDSGLPISSYFQLFQICLAFYSYQYYYQKFAVGLMILTSIATRFGVIQSKKRRSNCLQYTLFRINSSLNLVYSAFILVQQICQPEESEIQPYGFIFPLIFFLASAEFFHEFSDKMAPLTSQFFNDTNNQKIFIECIQYITDDLDKMTNIENQELTLTCLIPIYYEHLKNCKRIDCPLSHELQPQALNSQGHYKSLCLSVFKIAEQLFHNIMTVQHENINLKLALLKFYIRAGPNKLKIMHLVSQIENFHLTWLQKLKIYCIKRFVSDIDVLEFLQSMKIQDSYQSFSHNVSSLMRLLIEFWTQFLEDRVDFHKVLQITQKITPVINSIENQMEKSIQDQNFSTIRIMRSYSEYVRWILNDELKSAMISDYTNLLSKKMSEIHQINCMSADMEIGLVAISLNFKKLGEIKIANVQAANIFNYTKQDFSNLNVKSIMPTLYANHHDEFLKVFLVNENKKVNTDRRLLLAKSREGHLFEIYLQLQKSAITSSEQFIFIANIELAKMNEATILISCDDKGVLSNVNSTYEQIFDKSLKKNKTYEHKSYTNIQQLIPSFFDIVLDQKRLVKQSVECYDNPLYGIIQIKFQITKISFRHAPDVGYIIKGKRVTECKQQFFKHLSLTNSLVELAEDRDLKGMKIQYSAPTNEYIFSDNLDILSCGQFQSEHTIPYVKLQFFGKILNQNLQVVKSSSYDAQIKTIRYYGDHFQRVEQADSFQSQISEQEKTTINHQKFSLIKETLQNEENKSYKKSLITAATLLLILKIIMLSIFYITISGQKKETFINTFRYVESFSFRQKISQYILLFQAQNDSEYGQFFKQKKVELESQLVNLISLAELPQDQKQRALKIVYLEQSLKNQSFQQLISDDTIYLSTVQQIPQSQRKFIIFEAMFGVLIIIKLLFNFAIMQWHQFKITKIFSLFLGLSQSDIKKCHRKCVQFLKDSSEQVNQQEDRVAQFSQQIEQTEQDSSHMKIKRFKNISLGTSPSNFMKLNVFTLIFLIVTASMLINNWLRRNQVQIQKQAYQFVSTLMPEYSTMLMKVYSQKNQNIRAGLSQNFQEKYQTMEFNLANLKTKDIEQSSLFLQILFSDQCTNVNYSLPGSQKCQNISSGVMKNGVSKAVNYLSHRLAIIKRLNSSDEVIEQLKQLSILLYSLIQPRITIIKQILHQAIQQQDHMTQVQILLYFILLLSVAVSNTIYQCNYPLQSIYISVIHSKLLMSLLPQVKKKTKNGYMQI